MKKCFLFLVFLLVSSISAWAGLKWDMKIFEHTAAPGEERVTASFGFTNTGNKPVEILNLRATCGCTVPALEKRVYDPGEAGEIDVIFTYGSRTGQQNLTVSVFTDAHPAPTQLRLVVDIPVMVELTPRIVYWRRGEAMDPRAVRIKLAADMGIEITEVRPHNNAFAHRLLTEESGDLRLEITPPADGERQMGRFDLVSNFPEENPTIYPVFVGVR